MFFKRKRRRRERDDLAGTFNVAEIDAEIANLGRVMTADDGQLDARDRELRDAIDGATAAFEQAERDYATKLAAILSPVVLGPQRLMQGADRMGARPRIVLE